MGAISSAMIPLLVFFIIGYGLYKRVDVYDVFIEGSKESMDLVIHMFPCLLAMILGINILINSNVLEAFFHFMEPLLEWIRLPSVVFPMAMIRPISGSSSLAILNSILQTMGPDGYVGKLASVIQGSTDTTFYILTLYFGSVGITKIRYALFAGLFADLISLIASIWIVNILF